MIMEEVKNDSVNVEELAVGPGAIADNTAEPGSLLDRASEYEYVEVFNPLSVPFKGIFGVTRPVDAPVRINRAKEAPGVTATEHDVVRNYGLDLKNPDHQGKASITNTVTIPAGQTIRLLGNEAQVVVRQLVNEIMQRSGRRLFMADPHARREVERQVIRGRGHVDELLGRPIMPVRDQLQQAIKEPVSYEPEPTREEFPGAQQPPTEGVGSQRTVDRSEAGNDTSPEETGQLGAGDSQPDRNPSSEA